MKVADATLTGTPGWRGRELAHDAGRLALPDAAVNELAAAARRWSASGSAVDAIRPDDFALDAARAFASEVEDTLRGPLGFALIDRLPIERLGTEGAKAAYWLLCSLVERPVAQNFRGDLIYDVTDTGRPPGNGVRPDKTNAEQNFHTDNSYNHCPPNYVALLCVRPARAGGVSHIVSLEAAHAALKAKRPDLTARLARDFHFDRQREHAPGDVMTISHPLFEETPDDRLLARLSRFQVMNGHDLAGEALDDLGAEALDAFEAEMNAPGVDISFNFEPGQIQILNNRRIGHRRTGFQDWPDTDRKRLLVRLWLRDQGGRGYEG